MENTIKINIGFAEEMKMLILLLENANNEGKKYAKKRLFEIANILDKIETK